MFEKEADEYRKNRKEQLINDDEFELLDNFDLNVGIAFKDGAEFGYNKCKEELNQKGLALQSDMDKTIEQNIALKKELEKANEWHFVKDGICPTHSYRVLVFTDEGVGFGIYGLDDKKWHTYDTGFDVIAWKEIVLPKESE